MEFFEVIKARRSIRKYKSDPIPDDVIEKAFDAAILAPNSSNVQTWDFFWVRSAEKKEKLIKACLSQSAARTAQQLVVITADPKKWKRSQGPLLQYVRAIGAPKMVVAYYEKLIPVVYRWGFLNCFYPLKWLASFFVGIFKPILRSPFSRRDMQEVAIKSAALAAENFVLAISAQGYSTCMMEGFDEWRVRSLLELPWTARIVMVISVGKEAEQGTWGPQYRLAKDQVVHRV